MSHYERYEHAHQPQGDRVPTNDFTRQNLFGVPPDHDEWVKRIFGDQNSTSPEHEPAKVSIPNASMGSGGGSFADMYGQIMNDRAKGDSPSSTPSAIITAPLAFENIPPRSSSVLDETNPFTAMPPSLTPVTRAYHRMASRFVREYAVEGPQPPCTEADCPLSHIRHLQGTYLDNNTPALNPLYHLFGTSNPPANVWQAIHAGTQEEGTQEDTDLIARFIKYHVTGVRFSVVPHGNFIWGEEGGMNEGVAEGGQRPWVRLPFPALPLRVVFDAEVNFLDKV
ncbi:MAG: hypothetical protein L6R40_006150 [Gallowayella cf. fulva]|nr:MAG: hypothetical protein L6R40_006150 [Xanthomendoza cf. fulva]